MKLDRLISILVILLRKERVTAKELAELLGVSKRTILRDVDAINLAGIPVVSYQGVNGGLGIAEGYRLDKSVLTAGDMAAILTTLKGVAGTLTDSRHEILMEKIKNTLSESQLAMLNSKANQLIIDLTPWGGNEPLKEKIAAIRSGIENLNEIGFDYVDSEGKRTSRRVEPYSLVLKGQHWYMYGWCLTRQDFRLFKISRIKEPVVSGNCFKPREVSLEQPPWKNKGQKPENIIELDLIFEEELESIVGEWFGGKMEKCKDGRIMVRVSLPENNWLYGFLLSFGDGVEVAGPPHIRTIIAEIGAKIYNKYFPKMT